MKRKRKLHRYVLYALLRVGMTAAACLPYPVAVRLGRGLGRWTWRLLPRERAKTLEHLRLAFGSWTEAQLNETGAALFEHFGHLLAEWIKIDYLIRHLDEYVTAEGYEHLDRAIAAGKGIVVVAAHFGNWELMAGHAAMKGYPGSSVARKLYFDRYDRLMGAMRRKMSVDTIYRTENPRRMLQVLRKNQMLGFVADQAIEDVETVAVDFFGRPAWTPVAPVRFAQTSGAPLVVAFMVREGLRHRIIVEPPIELVNTGDREADLKANTQAWVSAQERYIRRYPHLWVWNHRRWKKL